MIRTYVPDVRPEGTTGSSKGFSYVFRLPRSFHFLYCREGQVDHPSQREQAEEGQYIRKKELEKLKQAQDKVTAAQKELVSPSTLTATFPAMRDRRRKEVDQTDPWR